MAATQQPSPVLEKTVAEMFELARKPRSTFERGARGVNTRVAAAGEQAKGAPLQADTISALASLVASRSRYYAVAGTVRCIQRLAADPVRCAQMAGDLELVSSLADRLNRSKTKEEDEALMAGLLLLLSSPGSCDRAATVVQRMSDSERAVLWRGMAKAMMGGTPDVKEGSSLVDIHNNVLEGGVTILGTLCPRLPPRLARGLARGAPDLLIELVWLYNAHKRAHPRPSPATPNDLIGEPHHGVQAAVQTAEAAAEPDWVKSVRAALDWMMPNGGHLAIHTVAADEGNADVVLALYGPNRSSSVEMMQSRLKGRIRDLCRATDAMSDDVIDQLLVKLNKTITAYRNNDSSSQETVRLALMCLSDVAATPGAHSLILEEVFPSRLRTQLQTAWQSGAGAAAALVLARIACSVLEQVEPLLTGPTKDEALVALASTVETSGRIGTDVPEGITNGAHAKALLLIQLWKTLRLPSDASLAANPAAAKVGLKAVARAASALAALSRTESGARTVVQALAVADSEFRALKPMAGHWLQVPRLVKWAKALSPLRSAASGTTAAAEPCTSSPMLHAVQVNVLRLLLQVLVFVPATDQAPEITKGKGGTVRAAGPLLLAGRAAAAAVLRSAADCWSAMEGCREVTSLALLALSASTAGSEDAAEQWRREAAESYPGLRGPVSAGSGCMVCALGGAPTPPGAVQAPVVESQCGGGKAAAGEALRLLAAAQQRASVPDEFWYPAAVPDSQQQQHRQQPKHLGHVLVHATAIDGSSSSSRSSSSGDGGSGGRRGCSVCGRTRWVDGGRSLHACRGCGMTAAGARYCSAACARTHWCRMGHRRQCEAAQAAAARVRYKPPVTGVNLEDISQGENKWAHKGELSVVFKPQGSPAMEFKMDEMPDPELLFQAFCYWFNEGAREAFRFHKTKDSGNKVIYLVTRRDGEEED